MKAHLVLVATALVACNGAPGDAPGDTDPDAAASLAGLYVVTSDAVAVDCADYVENKVPIPFLDVVEVGGVIEVRTCVSRSDCETSADLDYRFDDDGGGGPYKTFRTWTYYNDNSGGICANQSRRTTLRVDGDRIELASVEVSETLAAGDATDDDGCEAQLDAWEPTYSQGPYDCWKLAAEVDGT